MHLKKIFCQHFMKKSSKKDFNSKFSKNEPVCMSKEGWCVRLAQEEGCLREGGGNKNFKKGGGASWVKWWVY